MHWHAQPLRCSKALVLRGYRKGSYGAQSPYSALVLVLSHRGKHQIQGMLSDSPLKRRDLLKLSKVGRRKGVSLVVTRRHGKEVTIAAF